eukprot:TRINITY_DN4610_c0_g1_i5.p1 TRINITY_DN4610_c0_g1~~TRINITY_DN4610_c0_g1_i5.p1  ORF type:complete len:414 (+),score=60.29 TRINITY_DN4610_c0_g1_i5:61-1302(+)
MSSQIPCVVAQPVLLGNSSAGYSKAEPSSIEPPSPTHHCRAGTWQGPEQLMHQVRMRRADLRSMDDSKADEFNMVRWSMQDGKLSCVSGTARSYTYSGIRCGPSILASAPDFDFENAWKQTSSGGLFESMEAWLTKRILSPCFDEMAYSRLPYMFGEESSERAARDHSEGNCVAFAQYVLQKLREELELDESSAQSPAFIIPSTLPEAYHQPGYPHWAHAVVAIPLRDFGCIILDPAIRVPCPVVLRGASPQCTFDWADGPPARSLPGASSHTWRFELDSQAGQVRAFSPQQPHAPSFTYFTKTIENPDESITIPTNDFNKRIPVVRTDKEGAKSAHFSIRLDKSRLEACVHGIWKQPLQFAELRVDPLTKLQEWLPQQEASDLEADVDSFYKHILEIVQAHQDAEAEGSKTL